MLEHKNLGRSTHIGSLVRWCRYKEKLHHLHTYEFFNHTGIAEVSYIYIEETQTNNEPEREREIERKGGKGKCLCASKNIITQVGGKIIHTSGNTTCLLQSKLIHYMENILIFTKLLGKSHTKGLKTIYICYT